LAHFVVHLDHKVGAQLLVAGLTVLLALEEMASSDQLSFAGEELLIDLSFFVQFFTKRSRRADRLGIGIGSQSGSQFPLQPLRELLRVQVGGHVVHVGAVDGANTDQIFG